MLGHGPTPLTGDELRRIRVEELDLSQGQLARMLGLSVECVSRWERGERTPPPYLRATLRSVRRDLERARRQVPLIPTQQRAGLRRRTGRLV